MVHPQRGRTAVSGKIQRQRPIGNTTEGGRLP
jgi:hypothetical protein